MLEHAFLTYIINTSLLSWKDVCKKTMPVMPTHQGVPSQAENGGRKNDRIALCVGPKRPPTKTLPGLDFQLNLWRDRVGQVSTCASLALRYCTE